MKHYVLRKSEYKLYRTKYSVPPDPFNNTEKFKKSVLKIKRLIHRMQFSISYKYHEQIQEEWLLLARKKMSKCRQFPKARYIFCDHR